MKKGSYKEAILMAAMEEGYITTHGLSMLRDNEKYLQKAICDLTREGYLADRKITHTVKNRKYVAKYKAITKKGIEFAVKNFSDRYTYLKYIPRPLPHFHIVRSTTTDTIYNHLQSINASVLFKQIGLGTVCVAGSDIKDGLSFKEMIYNAKREDKIYNGTNATLSLGDVKMNYIHSNDLYPLFEIPEDEKQQILFTQQIGFLFYNQDTYIIYSAKKRGIKISQTMLKRVRGCFNRYTQKYGIETEFRTLTRGIMLADTPTEWVKAFKNNMDIRNKVTADKIMDALYLLPVGRDLVYMIDKVLYHSDNLLHYLRNVLLENDNQIEEYGSLIYRVREMVIGVDMNLSRLYSTYKSLKKGADKKYTIICFPWQEKYYRMVFPDYVDYYYITENCLIPPEYQK